MGKAPCCDKANVKSGPWSSEEDNILKKYVEKHGIGGNWIALPQKAGLKRCGKSCRLRWVNYLKPGIKRGDFTAEEDNIICSMYKNLGCKWSKMAAQLPGRTDNDIKNYFNTKFKKGIMSAQTNTKRTFNMSNHFEASSSLTPSDGYGFMTSTNENFLNVEPNKLVSDPVQISMPGPIDMPHSVGNDYGCSILPPQELSASSSLEPFEESFSLFPEDGEDDGILIDFLDLSW